jgi:hypothetical protein
MSQILLRPEQRSYRALSWAAQLLGIQTVEMLGATETIIFAENPKSCSRLKMSALSVCSLSDFVLSFVRLIEPREFPSKAFIPD